MPFLSALLCALGVVLFVAVLFGGGLMTLLGLPGTVVIVADALVYSALRHWKLPLWLIAVLLGMALVAEVSDSVVSALGVRKYGGSRKGMAWAFVGGIVGATVLGTLLGPLLGLAGMVIAPLLGGLLGGFLGAYAYERAQGRPTDEASRAGLGAMLGRVAGTALKSVTAGAMIVIVLTHAF